jgi:hypothetical protein
MMALSAFGRQLELAHSYLRMDPEHDFELPVLTRGAAQAFLGDIEDALASSAAKIILPSVGTLAWEGEISFEPSKNLADPSPKLTEFLARYPDLDKERLLNLPVTQDSNLVTFFYQIHTGPFSGLELLERIVRIVLIARFPKVTALREAISRTAEDPIYRSEELAKLFDLMSLTVHDAICCKAGIMLETVGLFTGFPDLKFTADLGLQRFLESCHRSPGREPDPADSAFWLED